MTTTNPYANLRWDDLFREASTANLINQGPDYTQSVRDNGFYNSSLLNGSVQRYYSPDESLLNFSGAPEFWGDVSNVGSAASVNPGYDMMLSIQDPNDTGYGYHLTQGQDGGVNSQRYRVQNGVPMEMLAVLAAPLMATFAPSLFGGSSAISGSLAEAMATYAPGWWEGVTAAGMGGAEMALPTAASFAGAAGIPEASLTEVMSQTNPTWWSDVTSAGMGDPGFAPSLTSGGSIGAESLTDVMNQTNPTWNAETAANGMGDPGGLTSVSEGAAGGSSTVTPSSGGSNGGLFNSGVSTGSPVVDNVAQRVLTNAATSAAVNAATGGNSGGATRPTSTTTGGSGGTNNGGGWNMPDATGGLLNGLLQNYVLNNNGSRITDVTNTSADTINALATNLAGQGTFTPYNITSGVGSTTTDANGNMTSQLSDAWRNIQGAAQAQIPSLLTPYSNPNVANFSNAAYGQANNWINRTANPLYAQNETAGLTGAGNLLGLAGQFNPETVARTEYDAMQALLAPTREQDNLNMENRLLQQGRLGLSYGSTGAAPELAALAQAQRMQDLDAALTSRATAFDRQNQILNQANTMNQMGIQSGAAGLNQQKGIYDIANGLFSSGMAGDNFMENMNVSRTSRARSLQDMALQPEQFLQNQQSQAITAGGARSTAAQNAARLQADLGLNAERIRSGGAMTEAALKNARDAAILQSVTGNGGAGGLLGGVGGAITGGLSGLLSQAANAGGNALQSLVGQLLNSGVQPGDLQGIMEQAGVNIDQYLTYGDELNTDSLLEWANAGDFGDTSSSVVSDIADWMEW